MFEVSLKAADESIGCDVYRAFNITVAAQRKIREPATTRGHAKLHGDAGGGHGQIESVFELDLRAWVRRNLSCDDHRQRRHAISHGAGSRWLSDFSLRRNGDIERAVDIATYAFIGGFNDTSNMEAAHRLDIPAVGTEAHYWQQAYLAYLYEPEIEPRTGQPKHFEQVAFECWLDANPNGTTLLLDTIDVYLGAVHAAMAATSNGN